MSVVASFLSRRLWFQSTSGFRQSPSKPTALTFDLKTYSRTTPTTRAISSPKSLTFFTATGKLQTSHVRVTTKSSGTKRRNGQSSLTASRTGISSARQKCRRCCIRAQVLPGMGTTPLFPRYCSVMGRLYLGTNFTIPHRCLCCRRYPERLNGRGLCFGTHARFVPSQSRTPTMVAGQTASSHFRLQGK